jgi:hypothetical protein
VGYVRYREKDQEVIDNRQYERTVLFPAAPPRVYYDCYYCDKSFDSVAERNSHIKKSHGVVGPLLFVNGKLCDKEVHVEKISSAKIVLCGFTDITVKINDQVVSNADEIDIMAFIHNTNVHDDLVVIGSREFHIYKYDSINVANVAVDSTIDSWEKGLEQDISISKNYPNGLNKAEIRYLDGFFDYYTACRTFDATEKKKRYEDAYALLSSFSTLTPKARVLLKVIAFRLNWVERLEYLCLVSKGAFDNIVMFFKGEEIQKVDKDVREPERRIFVEHGLAECLESIMNYQEGNWKAVDEYLETFSDSTIADMKDTNHKDRLLLIKARRMKQRGEYGLTRQYYKDIKTPYFRNEAKAFIKEQN